MYNYLVIYEYDETIGDEVRHTYELKDVINIVTRDGFIVVNFEDDSNEQFLANAVSISFER